MHKLAFAGFLSLIFFSSACPADPNGTCGVCDDGVSCTVDSCDSGSGSCVFVADNALCSAPMVCDSGEGCVLPQGACSANSDCDDGSDCTSDSCQLSAGTCVHAILVGQGCDDGDACTDGDSCQVSGGCQGVAMECNDGDSCTLDACDPATLSCTSTVASGALCDDGDRCTQGELCQADGSCGAGAAVDCIPTSPCFRGSCDPATGCVYQPVIGGSCDDGDACTSGESCQPSGSCGGGTAKRCDDGNSCTADSCQADGSCSHVAAGTGAPCEDGDVCTTGEFCQADGSCGAGSLSSCDDNNTCTVDLCDPILGCQHTPDIGSVCDDGDKCTKGDQCTANGCVGVLTNCDDGNLCTDDLCDPATGACLNTAQVGRVCDADGSGCTVDDSCDGTGSCVPGAPAACSDGDPCTTDTCSSTDPVVYSCSYPLSGQCVAVDWCRLQWPLDLNGTAGTVTTFYGHVYIQGVSDFSTGVDANPALRAELGYAPAGSDPLMAAGAWTWSAAAGNTTWVDTAEPGNDEYQADLALPAAAGSPYDFAFRFSIDSGLSWLYCDRDATATGGSDGSVDGYSSADAGHMIVQ